MCSPVALAHNNGQRGPEFGSRPIGIAGYRAPNRARISVRGARGITRTLMAFRTRISRDIALVAGWAAPMGPARKCSALGVIRDGSPCGRATRFRCNLSDAGEVTSGAQSRLPIASPPSARPSQNPVRTDTSRTALSISGPTSASASSGGQTVCRLSN